jgi:hypothetical protein
MVRPVARGIARWTARLALVLVAVAAAYAALLVFPTPLFSHRARYGAYRVYSVEPIAAGFDRVIDDLDRRVHGMEHPPPEASQRIYLCGPKTFALFAFLLRMNPESLAIGLSAANESFVSVDRVRLFAAANHGVLRHTRFEGNMAEVVAHEIAHFNSAHALGYRAHLSQPLWKSEGWAEYQANRSAIRADPDYDLARRVEMLSDDSYWGGRPRFARRMWEAQLLVEFLCEVKGYELEDLVQDEVTESSTREEMMAWYRTTSPAPIGATIS